MQLVARTPLNVVSSSLLAALACAAVTMADEPVPAAAPQAESRARVSDILRDTSRPAEQRIKEALAELDAPAPPDKAVTGTNPPVPGASFPAPLQQSIWDDPFFKDDPFLKDDPLAAMESHDPFARMQDFRSITGRLMAQMDREMAMLSPPGARLGGDPGPWDVSVETHETPAAYTYRLVLPGAGDAQANVTTHDGVLTIEGARESRSSSTAPQGRGTRQEMFKGTFRHELPLPADADAGHLTSTIKDGVLTVTVPRHPADKLLKSPILKDR